MLEESKVSCDFFHVCMLHAFVQNSSCQWFECVYLCGFVCLDSVAGANKVEGTMSWCLGTNEILASKHDIAVLKVKQGQFESAILILHNFVVFCYG